jgi:type I restriction enzyme S subunit
MVNGAKQLPDGWLRTTIGDIVTRMSNGTTAQQTKDGNGLPVTRIETISQGVINLERVGYLQNLSPEIIEKYRLEPGDILFSHINSDLHLGKTAIFETPGLTLLHGMNLLRLQVNQEIVMPRFFHYACNHLRYSAHFISIAQHAVNQSSINQKKLAQVPFLVPPLPEQAQIVAKIEELFTQLEAGMSALERVQAGLRRYKASVLKAAVEGKLLESGRVESNNGLPDGWKRVTWREISPRVTVGYVGKMKDEYIESGVPFLRGQNVRENRFDPEGLLHVSPEFHKRISKSTLNPGDIVVVRSGSVGVSCVIPETLEEANCSDLVIIKKPKEMIPEFGAYYLNSLAKSYVREKQVGVALTHFNTKSVADMPVPLPPLEEQRRIVAEVERRLSVAREVESVVEKALVRASRLRQAVLKSALEGRLQKRKFAR